MKRFLVKADGSKLTTAKLGGVKFLVCPVVALVGDSVVWASDSPYPEFVPAEILHYSVGSWNFRAAVLDHPRNDAGEYYDSANVPEVLERFWFGYCFNARVVKRKLCFDLWLDPKRAEAVGAGTVITRLKRGEIVEVSIGARVKTREEEGTHNGQDYSAVWEYIDPDHLATLPYGEGACSIEAGCGAGRRASIATTRRSARRSDSRSMAKRTQIKEDSYMFSVKTNPFRFMGRIKWIEKEKAGARTLFQSAIRKATVIDPSSTTSYYSLYWKLDKALRKIIPEFSGVYDFYPDLGQVLFLTYSSDDYKTKWWRCSYKVRKGDVVLGGDVTEVEAAMMFKDKTSGNATTTETLKGRSNVVPLKRPNSKLSSVKTVSDKGDPNNSRSSKSNKNLSISAKGTIKTLKRPADRPVTRRACDCKKEKLMQEKTQKTSVRASKRKLISKILARNDAFNTSHVKLLMGFDQKTLRKLASSDATAKNRKPVLANGPATVTANLSKKKPISKPKAKPKTLTTSEWLSNAPREVRDLFKRHSQMEARHRGKIIKYLTSNQSQYSAKALEKMETKELENLKGMVDGLLGVNEKTDFTGRGLSVLYDEEDGQDFNDDTQDELPVVDGWAKLRKKEGQQ